MTAFTSSIVSAQRTGTHTYTGRFEPSGRGIKSFLPVGAASIVSIAMPPSPFTITTDDQGWVTSIEVELTPGDGPKVTTTTTMCDHGEPLEINAPARSVEAADFYYREWQRLGGSVRPAEPLDHGRKGAGAPGPAAAVGQRGFPG